MPSQPTSLLSRDAATHTPQQVAFSRVLNALREEFHSIGRFDDGNAKLDEISKLLFLKFHEEKRSLQGKLYRFCIDHLQRTAQMKFGDPRALPQALAALFQNIATDSLYQNPDGTSIFGNNPTLNIQPTDADFAFNVVQLLDSIQILPSCSPQKTGPRGAHPDLLNQAFDHFVRDLFRNTKEDAQYMTPPEAVAAMVDLAFYDIETDPISLDRLLQNEPDQSYIILDPTCGVGSFMVAALSKATALIDAHIPDSEARTDAKSRLRENSLWGQDKVDRMVRLAKLNLLFSGASPASIVQGNSILGKTMLDELNGKVDLILTNPPFGAKFKLQQVLSSANRDAYPMLQACFPTPARPKSSQKTILSEIALLDRCLQLLRPGGRLLIVLPDNVVSAKGNYKKIRNWLVRRASLKAVIQLPSEAFAQAGTRTKTSIVYLQKRIPLADASRNYIYMAVCEDMGYKVVERVGMPTKVPRGSDELVPVAEAYRRGSPDALPNQAPYIVCREEPGAVWISQDGLLNGRWTPSFYSPRRLMAIEALNSLPSDFCSILPLREVADFVTRQRSSEGVSNDVKCISVLHVAQEGTISLGEVDGYNPEYPGTVCRSGDILFAKINPRIQRVAVVPELPYQTTCSGEFEILRARKGYSPYAIAALLRLPWVYDQIVSLTGGTSSSHNRIKDTELEQVLLPIPRSGETLDIVHSSVSEALAQRYGADELLRAAQATLEKVVESHFDNPETRPTH